MILNDTLLSDSIEVSLNILLSSVCVSQRRFNYVSDAFPALTIKEGMQKTKLESYILSHYKFKALCIFKLLWKSTFKEEVDTTPVLSTQNTDDTVFGFQSSTPLYSCLKDFYKLISGTGWLYCVGSVPSSRMARQKVQKVWRTTFSNHKIHFPYDPIFNLHQGSAQVTSDPLPRTCACLKVCMTKMVRPSPKM